MTSQSRKRRFATFNLDVCAISNESYNFMILESSSNSSDRLEDYDLITSLNLIVSLFEKFLDLFRESTMNSRDA